MDGDPARRLPSAADLAERLLHLDQRRAEIEEKERLAREAAARAEAEAAAAAARLRAARFRKLAAAFAVLALLAIAGGVLSLWQARVAWVARAEAERGKSAATTAMQRENAALKTAEEYYRALFKPDPTGPHNRNEKLPALRGAIMDRHGKQLARSIPLSTIVVDKNYFMNPNQAVYSLAHQMACKEPGWHELDAIRQRNRINWLCDYRPSFRRKWMHACGNSSQSVAQ